MFWQLPFQSTLLLFRLPPTSLFSASLSFPPSVCLQFLLLFHRVFTSICFASYQIFLCPPPTDTDMHSQTLSASLLSLSPSIPSVGLRWRDAIRFPISGPPARHTQLDLNTLLLTSLICTGALWPFIFPCGARERSALLVYSWLCCGGSVKLAVPLLEQILDSAQTRGAQTALPANCAVVWKDRTCVISDACVCTSVCFRSFSEWCR